MEKWLFFAILSVFATWLYNFLIKVSAEKHYDVSLINIFSYLIMIIVLLLYIILSGYTFTFDNISIIIFLAFINSFLFSISMFTKIWSMKCIETVIFFPITKTFWPVIVTLISVYYFKELLSLKELIWILIWIIIPFLLVSNTEIKRQKKLFLWLFLAFLTALLWSLTTSASNEIMKMNYDVILYLLIWSISWLILSIFSYLFLNKKKEKKVIKKWFFKLVFIIWLLYSASFLSFTYALEWNFAIVFTINSFSILIPIILSIIFYKEHFNFLKWFVILLSIFSILLFI